MTQEIDQREAARFLLKLKRASLSFGGFMSYLYEDFVWPSFMTEYQEVLDLLEKDALVSPGGNPIRQLLVTMPPRHAKSFNGTVNFPAYLLMRNPTREVLIGSYNDELATTFGRQTRDIVIDPRVRKAFPSVELSRETRAVDFWKTKAGGAYYGVGMDGTTTGRGANFVGIDDPYKSRKEADSATIRRQVWDHYAASFRSRMQPTRGGQPPSIQVTHTRWHPDDLAGRIMETPEFKAGKWLHLNFQALTTKERGVYIRRNNLPADDLRYVPTEMLSESLATHDRVVQEETEVALWPERFDVKFLNEQRSIMLEREFSALYQQQPYVVGGNIFKEAWLKRYKPDELPEFSAVVFGVDTAFKAKAHNDYSVFTIGGVTELGDIYVLRVWRERLEFPELKRKAVALNAAYRGKGLRGFFIEDAASGQPLIQELKRDTGVPVIPWKPGAADKVARANSVTPLIEGGRVFVPEEADWLDDWLTELASFPSAKHDDQVDSFVILLDVLSRMIVTGQPNWAAPIGDFIKEPDFAGAGAFTGQELKADPKGWAGGFGSVSGDFDKVWNGWGQ